MRTTDGRYVVTFNGEIYNYKALRDELAVDGVTFKSNSDTEVLLHLFRRFGEGMLHRLRGMFAFAIWDTREQRLFLARDPHGIKPLYYSHRHGTFRFASQVQALLAGQSIPRQVSPAGLVGFLMWGSVPEPITFYEHISLLPAGHSLMVDGNGVRTPRAYWSIADAIEASYITGESVPVGHEAALAHNALRESVRAHLTADVPIGAFLSAGLDSSAIVALAKQSGLDIHCITVTVDEFVGESVDEAPLAKEIARRYDLPHEVITLNVEDAREQLPLFFDAMDQPTVDGINTWFVAAATRQCGLKVALSGVGGDELFGGYSTFALLPQQRNLALGRPAACSMSSLYEALYQMAATFVGTLPARRSERFKVDWFVAYHMHRGLFMPWELSRLLRPEVLQSGLSMLAAAERWERLPKEVSDFGKVQILESSRYMRNQLLRDMDWVGMRHSLELRTPLVDQRLTEAVSGLAAQQRLGLGKSVLAQCHATDLVQRLINRPKTGFMLPIWHWLHKLEDLASWKRIPWLRRPATSDFSRWGYSVIARMPECADFLR
jgi:asparagine synthase (glutamine-hydrolysing)